MRAAIAREDLVARLDQATTRKVTVISAPAGSGKTSLLRAWSGRRDKGHRIAFVSVGRAEDAQRFWLALLTAIRQAAGMADEPESPAATPDFNAGTLADAVLAGGGAAPRPPSGPPLPPELKRPSPPTARHIFQKSDYDRNNL